MVGINIDTEILVDKAIWRGYVIVVFIDHLGVTTYKIRAPDGWDLTTDELSRALGMYMYNNIDMPLQMFLDKVLGI